MEQTSQKFTQMEDDIQELLECKQELEGLLDQFRSKLSKKKEDLKYVKESLHYKEQEADKTHGALRKVTQVYEDTKK